MLKKPTPARRLAALAALCLVTTTLSTAPAWAQKTKNKNPPAEQTAQSAPKTELSVDIPTIETDGSNLDENTLRDIFSGNVAGNADALARLTAKSIDVPEITVSASSVVDGETTEFEMTFSDIVLSDVVNGTAAIITLGGITATTEDTNIDMGTLSAANFDIAGVLGLYGLVDASGQTELETIYTDFSFGGGTVSGDEIECTIGAASAAEFKARPLNHSFAEIMTLSEALEESSEDGTSDPKMVGDALRMYVDLLTAFETSPISFEGFDCSGIDDEDRSVAFSVASMSVGAMRPGYYPSYTVDDLDVTIEGDGAINVGNLTVKGMDISGPIAAINAAPQAVDDAWFAENGRALIPAFEGFSLSDVSVDVSDPAVPDERIVGGIGAFDLTLGGYLNGIPTQVSTQATNIVAEIPADTDDVQLAQLRQLGISSLDLGFALKANWNEAEDSIELTELSVTGADLATVKLAGTFANATEALFGMDEDAALAAAMGIVISKLNLDVLDQGLSDIILATLGAEQDADPATLRPVFAGLAEGTVIGIMAGAAEAQKVGGAINSFISGKAKRLNIDLTAKEEPGLGIEDFMAAETDPSILIGKVNISATAK
ncbi:hypothetical protein [Devosia submarina]|uniref:hypothetical protein n=1 Tax=Devosia submarina TaxID=1173082 RepID=UPI000D3702B8|nr:hypothetical protein [Devosia submarina]